MMRLPSAEFAPAVGAALALALAVACGGENQGASPKPKPPPTQPAAKPPPEPEPPAPLGPAELAERGRRIYMSNCIACHNPDPAIDGALGPAVTGSSEELIQARVIDGTYPEGYEPKRTTQVMIALPHLKPEVPALAAYLNE